MALKTADDVKLLGIRASPHVLRVRLALGLKGLSYDYVEQDPRNNHKIGDLLRDNKVPVLLIHDGKPVCGSLNIIQYVDEAFANGTGPSLLPAGCHDRAVARYWANFIDDTLIEAMYEAAWGETPGEKADGKNQAAAAVEALEGALRECSKPFFGGDNPGYVDVVLGSLLTWVCAAETFDPATTPLLAAWRDRFSALDAAQGVMPDMGKVVGFATMMPASHPKRSDLTLHVLTVFFMIPVVCITWMAL